MISVLFLDFDGVLNSHEWFETRHALLQQGAENTIDLQIDPLAVGRLNGIIEDTNCSVVISSTWRRGNSLEYLVQLLVKRGLKDELKANFIGMTPVLDAKQGSGLWTSPERGHEIQSWLNSHEKFDAVAILDDDADMVHLMHRLVLTDAKVGLNDYKAAETVNMLSL